MPKQTAKDIIDELAYRDAGFSEDPDFEEVELRLQTAQYYQLLLRQDLFDDVSAAAQAVQGEMREFIRVRIKVLLGLESAKINVIERDPVFSPDEILALKELAHRLLEVSGTLNAPEPAEGPVAPQEEPEPVPRPTPPPALKRAPAAKPGPQRASKKPTLRKVSVPAELREDASTQAATAPTAKTPLPKKPIKPSAKPAANGIEELPPNPQTGARRVRQNGRVLEVAIDPEDGAILTNEKGLEIWKDITPPAKPAAGYVPMPMGSSQPGSPLEQAGMRDVLAVQQSLADPNNLLSSAVSAVLAG